MFKTFYTLVPTITQQYNSRLQVIFRQQIQPWHPSSTLTHEAGAAVLRLAPDKFWDFSAVLFERQTEFFDVSVANETRNKTYERLAKIAGSVGVDEQKLLDLLKIPEQTGGDGDLNAGNHVTNDIKWMTKARPPKSAASERSANARVGQSGCGSACDAHCILQRKKAWSTEL